jgi:hypothetical protein
LVTYRAAQTRFTDGNTAEPEATFEAWTKSEAFRLARRDAAENKQLYLDHPQFDMNTFWSLSHRRISSKLAIPSSPQAMASPSIMQDRERSRARAATIRGKRAVRSLPGHFGSFAPPQACNAASGGL